MVGAGPASPGTSRRTVGAEAPPLAPAAAQRCEVGVEGPGVVVEVVGVAELQRVHEDGHRHEVALGRGPSTRDR